MNATVLNNEKALLAREILGISDIDVLNEVKRRLSGVFRATHKAKADNTASVLNSISGKWRDSRNADAMVDDIYRSRTSRRDGDLISILNS